MTNLLHSFFHSITTAKNEQEIRSRFMDNISELFGVQRWGIYLLNEENQLQSFDVHGVSDDFVDRYEKHGKSVDPVLEYVLKYHAPAHEELVLPQGTWKQSELYQKCCSEYDHEHIMTGAIVGQGRIIGTVHFARIEETPAFNTLDLSSLSGVCTHLSACLAQTRKPLIPNPLLSRLTPREIEIAKLVATGATNVEIGAELWITRNSVKQALKRMFRKLEISSRTEMVAKLQDILQE